MLTGMPGQCAGEVDTNKGKAALRESGLSPAIVRRWAWGSFLCLLISMQMPGFQLSPTCLHPFEKATSPSRIMWQGGHPIEEIEAPTRKADKIEKLGAKLRTISLWRFIGIEAEAKEVASQIGSKCWGQNCV